MKIGAEAESMDHDVAAPRRRVAESVTEHSSGAKLPEAPVLIRLPDLYPSARDDAAVARLAGRAPQAEAKTTATISPPHGSTASEGRSESVAQSVAGNTSPIGDARQRQLAEAVRGATTIVSPSAPLTGSPPSAESLCSNESDAAPPTSMVQMAGLQDDNPTSKEDAEAKDTLLPKILLAAERHDLGVHVFRVLLVTLLIASLYLVFERTRRDGAIAQNDRKNAESGWEQEDQMSDSERAMARSKRDASDSPSKTAAETEQRAKQEFDAPVHRVAKRSESEFNSGRADSESPRRGEAPSDEPARPSRERQSPAEPRETSRPEASRPEASSPRQQYEQQYEWERTDRDSTRTAAQPTDRTSRDDREQQESYFPSTPVNFDDLPVGRDESNWSKPEIPWEPSSRYQDPPEGHAPAAAPPSQWNDYNTRWEPPAHQEREATGQSGPRRDEVIPPYTPVTLRPRSEPQYPPAGNFTPPSQMDPTATPYLPPTSFSPPASASNPASGWPTETLR
jgi:hypothetical protein